MPITTNISIHISSVSLHTRLWSFDSADYLIIANLNKLLQQRMTPFGFNKLYDCNMEY